MTDGRRIGSLNPLYVAAYLYLWLGLVLAAYHGLEWLALVPGVSWIGWSHIHIVTIGAFTQLLFGFLPAFAARRLHRPTPSVRYSWGAAVGLNVGLALVWYGRSFGSSLSFELGLYLVWLLALGLFVVLLRMALGSARAWDATVGLYLVATFVFLWGITYAYGLYAHVWQVPGGWLGLRESHIHANGWGFFGLAAIGTLYDLFPRLVGTDLHSDRLKNYSAWLFVVAIFPLVTGPWLGMTRTVTAGGLLLFVVGFVLYLYNLARTYRDGTSSGLGLWLLVAQLWILGPALGAPFVFFGAEWVNPAYVEMGVLHFFFIGWALSIVFVGVVLYASNYIGATGDERSALGPEGSAADSLPAVVSPWMVATWNAAMLALGVGFFYQDRSWAASLFAPGTAILVLLWGYYLVQAVRLHGSLPRWVGTD